MQIVARSLETALHKLHALKFDVPQVVSGFGRSPCPRRRKTTSPRSVEPMTPFSTAAACICGRGQTMTSSPQSVRKSLLARRTIMGGRLQNCLLDTIMTFTRSTRTCCAGGSRVSQPNQRTDNCVWPNGAGCPAAILRRLNRFKKGFRGVTELNNTNE